MGMERSRQFQYTTVVIIIKQYLSHIEKSLFQKSHTRKSSSHTLRMSSLRSPTRESIRVEKEPTEGQEAENIPILLHSPPPSVSAAVNAAFYAGTSQLVCTSKGH